MLSAPDSTQFLTRGETREGEELKRALVKSTFLRFKMNKIPLNMRLLHLLVKKKEKVRISASLVGAG